MVLAARADIRPQHMMWMAWNAAKIKVKLDNHISDAIMSSISEGAKKFSWRLFYTITGIKLFTKCKCNDFILVTM